jgi:hypothetical protein
MKKHQLIIDVANIDSSIVFTNESFLWNPIQLVNPFSCLGILFF